ncbi:MAG TPA: hypothetical protein VII92_09960, partial [Anaerolineae bacterium]
IPQEHYTLMLASNALMVVLFQFQIARWVDEHDRSRMLALGAALYAIGFGIGPVIAGSLFDVGLGRWIWIGSLILGLAVAFGFRAFGPRLRAREALIEA